MQNALLKVLLDFEAEFKLDKLEFNDKLHREMSFEMKSLPDKFKGPMHRQLDVQMNVWSAKMMVKFKLTLNRVLLSFVNNNAAVNGYANEVVQMLMSDLVTNPEKNLTNQLVVDETGDGHLYEGSTSSKPIRKKRTFPIPRSNGEECNQVEVVGPKQSTSSSMKKAKLDSTQSSNAQSPITRKPPNYSQYFTKSSSDVNLSQHCKVKFPLVSSQPQSTSTELNTQTTMQQVPVQSRKVHNASMVVRVGLKCFQLGCQKMFRTEKDLNQHMITTHRIRAYPCLVCNQSFDDTYDRLQHIRKDHSNRSVWHCARCPEQFKKHESLFNHHYTNHLALFQCAFVNCGYTSTTWSTVSYHYAQEHKLACGQSGCGLLFDTFASLAQHERSHRIIKPPYTLRRNHNQK